jgi:hypothetical protein
LDYWGHRRLVAPPFMRDIFNPSRPTLGASKGSIQGKIMRKFTIVCGVYLLSLSQSAFAYDWQTPLMWDWALNTASPKLTALENENASQQVQIEALQAEVDALSAIDVDALQAQVDAMDSYVQLLQAYIEVDETTKPTQPVVRVVSANLQVVSGSGSTHGVVNGTGNLIVGYDEAASLNSNCSNGAFDNQIDCEAGGRVWATNHKSGSHNLVVGADHSYSRYGGLVAGNDNVINGSYVSVSGGYDNTASYIGGSVSGGHDNTASGIASSVSGGFGNTASEINSSVSGGRNNTASAFDSSVSGGLDNTASGDASSVSGGYLNTASGNYSSVSGGYQRSALSNDDWVAGALFQDN